MVPIKQQKKLAADLHHGNVTVVDGKCLSSGLALIVRSAVDAARKGLSGREVLKQVQTAIANTKFWALVPNLDYVVQGGRISANKAKWANRLRLTPVISFDAEGKVTVAKLFFLHRNLAKRFAKFALRKMKKNKKYKVIVSHLQNINEAKQIAKLIRAKRPDLESIDITETGCVIGVHSGPGSLAIAVIEL